jgi:nitrogen regulatory protein PII 2
MKEVVAIVRSHMVGATKLALANAGFPAFNCVPCLGRGKKMLSPELVELIMKNGELPRTAAGESMTEATRLIPKRMFSLVVKDEGVGRAVEVIIGANSRGRPGDGKIFVLPVMESYSIRLGEQGE